MRRPHTQDRPEHAWRPSAHRGIGRLNLGLRSRDGASPDWGTVTVSQRLTAPVDSSVWQALLRCSSSAISFRTRARSVGLVSGGCQASRSAQKKAARPDEPAPRALLAAEYQASVGPLCPHRSAKIYGPGGSRVINARTGG